MRHSKRKKLSTDDVERALKWYNARGPSLGHQHNDTEPSYVQVPDVGRLRDGEAIYAPEEQVIDLHEYALSSSYGNDGNGSELNNVICEASWISLEGNVVEEVESKGVNFPDASSLNSALLQYFQVITSVMLNDAISNSDRNSLLNDVKTNSKIGALVPFIVNFISTGMQRHSENQALNRRFLCIIDALLINPYLNLSPKPYLSRLVTQLLSTLITDRPNKMAAAAHDNIIKMDHVSYASQILKVALDKWSTPVNQLRQSCYKALTDYLCDPKSSLGSKFGALQALQACGPSALHECVLPNMDQILENLETKIHDWNHPSTNGHGTTGKFDKDKIHSLNLMKGTLLIAARTMIESKPGSIPYSSLYYHFGDSLSCVNLHILEPKVPSVGVEQPVKRKRVLQTSVQRSKKQKLAAHFSCSINSVL